MKAPLPSTEAARLEALHRYEILDTAAEAEFDDLTRLASQICGTPIALLTLIDAERQWFKSSVGFGPQQTPRAVAFCAHTILQPDLLVVPDTTRDPRFADNPFVVGEPFIRFYAAAPLRTDEGHGLGTLCVLDRQPRALAGEQAEALRALSRQAMAQLELRRHVQRLQAEAAAQRRAESELRRREQQLAAAQQLAHLGSWQWELDTNAITWSDELYRIFGLEPGELDVSFEGYLERVHADDRAAVRTAIEQARRQGGRFVFEERIVRPGGEVRILRSMGEAQTDEFGRAVRLVGTCHDITPLKEAELQARVMADRMRAVAAAAAGVIGANSLDELQAVLRDACARVIPFDAFTFALYDAAEHTLAYLGGYDAGHYSPAETISARGVPSERAIHERRSLVAHTSADPEAAGAHLMGTGRRSESVIRTPILSGDEVIGVLAVHSYTPHLYGDRDVEVLEAIAALAATALANLRLAAEHRAAEQALRASEASYRAIFELVHEGIYIHDVESGALLDVNPQVSALHGYTADEFRERGLELLTAVGSPYGPAEAMEYLRCAAAGEPQLFEWQSMHRDGHRFWLEVSLRRVAMDGTDRLLATTRDITARRAAEEARRIADTRFRTIFEQFPLSLQIFSPDGRTREVNQAWRNLFRMGPEELGDFNPLHDPQLQEIGPYLRRGFAGETLAVPATPFRVGPGPTARDGAATPNGENGIDGENGPRWIQAFVCPVKEEGGAVREVIIIHQDVTAQREAEEVLRRSHEDLERRVEERTAELAETNMALEEEIAERERAEQELLRKTSELEAVFQALPDLYFRLDADGRILDYKAGRSRTSSCPPRRSWAGGSRRSCRPGPRPRSPRGCGGYAARRRSSRSSTRCPSPRRSATSRRDWCRSSNGRSSPSSATSRSASSGSGNWRPARSTTAA